jgi:hypothetical protein
MNYKTQKRNVKRMLRKFQDGSQQEIEHREDNNLQNKGPWRGKLGRLMLFSLQYFGYVCVFT